MYLLISETCRYSVQFLTSCFLLCWCQSIIGTKEDFAMRTLLNVSLISTMLAAGILLQGCSDGSDNEEPVAQNQPATDEKQGATETSSSMRPSAPANADATILSPEDGASVSSPVTVKFGLEGMEVAKAGNNKPDSGHHHLLVDLKTLPPMNAPLPSNDQVIHFGGGQTSTQLELEPGEHTLQLLVGDYKHVPHQPPVMSEKITITVE
jgi:hypothetical protein